MRLQDLDFRRGLHRWVNASTLISPWGLQHVAGQGFLERGLKLCQSLGIWEQRRVLGVGALGGEGNPWP